MYIFNDSRIVVTFLTQISASLCVFVRAKIYDFSKLISKAASPTSMYGIQWQKQLPTNTWNITLISLCSTSNAINQFRTRRNMAGKTKSPTVFLSLTHQIFNVCFVFNSSISVHTHPNWHRRKVKQINSILRCQFVIAYHKHYSLFISFRKALNPFVFHLVHWFIFFIHF